MLEHVSDGTQPGGLVHDADRAWGAHDHHGNVRLRFPQPGQKLDAVHLRHVDVQQQQLRLVSPHEIECGSAVGGFPAFLDSDFPPQQADERPHMRFVIHDQGVDGARHTRGHDRFAPSVQACRGRPGYSARRM
jgi:hypothetical protein